MRVLLVEDDAYKRDRVLSVLGRVAGFDVTTESRSVTNVFDASRAIKEYQPHVLILDIALPLNEDSDPQPTAGVELLQDVLRHPQEYPVPEHVVGITAYQDIYEQCGAQFASWLLSLVLYRAESSDWEHALSARMEHILKSDDSVSAIGSDLAIVCALETPELAAVLALPWEWSPSRLPGDHTIYYRGRYPSRNGMRHAIAAASARKGMPAAVSLAGKIIHGYRPRVVAMVGIAAGVRGRVQFGDVVVANPCWDWGSGKVIQEGSLPRFLAAPFQAPLDATLREQVRELARDSAALQRVRSEWDGDAPTHMPAVKLGPMASGASVLADSSAVARVIDQQRELLAIEMEAYGLFIACEESAAPRPKPLVAKSVVDFGDTEKDDRFQAYGAYTSAKFLHLFAERYL